MNHRSGNPVVKVLVNNEGPFHFLIDTCAAGHARIDQSLVEHFGLRATGTVLAGDGSGRNRREVEVVRIDSLDLGEATFSGIDALAGDYRREQPDSGPPILGILCFGLFADCLLTIDYPRSTITLEKGLLRGKEEHCVVFSGKDEIPSIEMTLAGRTFTADVDTGSRGGLMVPLEAKDRLALESEPVAAGTARTRFNEVEISKARADGDLSLAGQTVSRPMVYFADLFPQANVGYEILQNFVLTFDQKNKRVQFRSDRSREKGTLGPSGTDATIGQPSTEPPDKTDLPWNPVFQAMEMADGKPVVEAAINGKGPFRFYLDTATPYTLLDSDFAGEIGLAPERHGAKGGKDPVQPVPSLGVVIETLSIGSAVFSGVEGRLGSLGDSSRSTDQPVGVLGFRLFADCLLTLDYPEKRVIVERGQLLFPDGKEVLDLIIKDDSPFALITLGPVNVETCIDSGSTKSLVLPSRLRPTPIEAPALFGGHTIQEPVVDFNDSARHASAGSEFLRSFSLTFDQKNRRIRIAQPH